MTARRFIPVPDAAARLGISPQAYYAGAQAGTLPGTRVGHRVTVPVAALERLIEERSRWATLEEAADFIGVSPSSYLRGIRRGDLPGEKHGQRYRISRDDLEAFAQRTGAA